MSSLRSKPEGKIHLSPSGGTNYWRSLERLLDSPAVRDLAEPQHSEFPAGASDAPGAVDRRTMLTLMGASFALVGLEGCRRPAETIVPYVSAPEYTVPGIPKRYATTLPSGAGARGVVVESHEGRPTKIEGNELHPSSLGAADIRTQAEILNLFDPDRSARVKRRATGETIHRPSSWKFFEAFLAERRPDLEAADGEGLAVLSGGYSSPTLARLATAVARRFPKAQWVVYEPIGDDNIFAGCHMATGKSCRPVYHLEKARKILALDADILNSESEGLAAARGFAAGRKAAAPGGDMNRLYVVESALSITGSAADHRLRLRSREIQAFAAALARELGVETGAKDLGEATWSEAVGNKLKVLAADLAASRGEALVVAGRRQPAAVHSLALAMNQALGSLGTTVTLHQLEDTGTSAPQAVVDLVGGMREGAVKTLLILGGNPAYTMPADLDFAGALDTVEHSVHLSGYFDETSRRVNWHLPEAHVFEAWGDARAADGSPSVIQPLIAPLHGGRSAVEVLDRLLGETPDTEGAGGAASGARSGYDVVRDTWLEMLGADDFERKWRRVLHDGVATEAVLGEGATQAAEIVEALAAAATGEEAGRAGDDRARDDRARDDSLELTFHPSLAVWDGRFANNAWLQELPDAITKITWDNAALISPATAEQFDLASGDLVTLGYRDRTLDVPVFVLPGQADGSVALTLGYGRTAAGRVGDNVGVNAFLLRYSAAPDFDSGLSLTKIKGSHQLAQTQEHWDMEGRDLIREANLSAYREDPGIVGEKPDPDKSHQLFPPPVDYDKGPQWGMAIDLGSCIGCSACAIACQSENNVPVVGKEQVANGREMHWLRVDRYFTGSAEEPQVAFQPVPCMQCENAPCEQVCPVAATVHDREGLNAMVYNRCIGTRYCSNNCPYKVRRFNYFNYTKDTPELMKMAMNPDVTVRSRGVMEKCTYCLQRLSEAKIAARREGRALLDGEVKTACQQTCPTDAIAFGDVSDPRSEVSRRKASERDYLLLGELNNRPRTSYLARLRNPNPEWA